MHRWLPGTPAYDADVAGSAAFARDLGTVVLALRAIGTGGRAFPGDARGGRLADHDDAVAAYLHDAEGMIDTDALRASVGPAARDAARPARRDGPTAT